MYLKSIEVHGFKSFANKIVFEFHNGITGIVGPNGSGKSNVADAARWVLGEQKVKQLRSSSMQDVIFAGTENRKPVSFAYVAITLDNSDHKLPLDYNEVTVARRVYRSGESEYLINGTQCRLKDVNELFYDTGIGKEGYSIIGQGQIDKILSGKPEERRELFDEAAGIVKFKRRKATALKKLEDEQQNLVRVNDILSELERQVGPLERQAEHAKIYLKKKEELKDCDRNLFLIEMDRMNTELRKLEQKCGITEHQQKETTQNFEKAKTRYEELEENVAKADERIGELQQRMNETGVSREKLEGQINVLREQIHTAQQNEEHVKSRIEALEADVERQRRSGEEYSSKQAELEEKIRETEQKKATLTERLENLRKETTAMEQQIEDGKAEILHLLNARASMKAEQQRLKTMQEQASIRRAQLNKELLEQKSGGNDVSGLLQKQEKELAELKENIASMEEEKASMEQKRSNWRQQFEELRGKMDQCKEEFHKDSSRLESLRNIAERYDGYGNSIRRIMERKADTPGIHGVIADLIKVDKRYETAIETALGGSIQNIVTDNEDTARQMIEYLKKNRYGRATFLPLTSVSAPEHVQAEKALGETGVIGIASSLVHTEPQYEGVAGHLLGRVLVMDTIEHAVNVARKFCYSLRIVTLEGESLQPGGSMTGGAFRNNSNLLGRNREIEVLEKQIAEYREQAQEIRNRMEDVKTANALLKDDYEELQVNLQQAYLHKNTLEMETGHIREQQEKQEAAYTGIHEEIAKIDADKKSWTAEQEQMAEQMQLSVNQENEITEQNKTLAQQVENKNLEIESVSQDLNEILLEIAQKQQQKSFQQQNIQRIAEEIRRLEQEKAQILHDSANSESVIEEREAQIRQLQEQSEETVQQKTELDEKLVAIRGEKEAMLAEQKSFFTQREELSQIMSNLDKEMFRLNQQKEKTENAQESLNNYMWEEYEITYHAAKEQEVPEEINVSDLKKQIAEIRNEIRKLGNVNVNAIEEYKEVSERYEFLHAQHADLEEAKASLEKIITDLDEGMRKQFAEKFADIQTAFDKTFKELFGGGKGSLELTGEEETKDILECGIRIIAQPPGKKLQNMMQLSGGEKALTAIALLFAIQNLKPSPFCLLDEIEAALDDSNVDRFANYLHKLTKNTQFIVITHRRGTMTAADRLYGITMQEKGVSALVSVNLIEKELDA